MVAVASIDRFDPMLPVRDGAPKGHHPKDFLPEARSVISIAQPVLNPVIDAPARLVDRELEMIPDVPVVDPDLCNGCRNCLKPAHCIAIDMPEDLPVIDPEKCIGCSACVAVCPSGALSFKTYAGGPTRS